MLLRKDSSLAGFSRNFREVILTYESAQVHWNHRTLDLCMAVWVTFADICSKHVQSSGCDALALL